MGIGRHKLQDVLIYLAAFVLALAIAAVVSSARSGGYDSDVTAKPGPRWSNAEHHESATRVGPNCIAPVPGLGARYEPGLDAYGRVVVPAEPSRRVERILPHVGFDIRLDDKKIAGYPVEIYAGQFAFNQGRRDLDLNGLPLTQDCVPLSK